MKPVKLLFFVCLAVFGSLKVAAQRSVQDVVKEWERAKTYTRQYLDAMPDSGYALKPTPEMRSFADQMLHLADDNYFFATVTVGETNPYEGKSFEKTTDKSKATVTKEVMDSYDFMIATIKKLTDAQLREHINLFKKFDISREVSFDKGFEHQTHHRGQTTVYLRLAGVKPPQERLF